LEILGGEQRFPVRLVSAGWSPALPAGGVEANVIYVGAGGGEGFARGGGDGKGLIFLVFLKICGAWADVVDEYALPAAIIERAVKGGAAAILWMGARERLLLYRHTNAGDGQLEVIPQAVVAREDAMHLARAVEASGGKLRIRFAMP